MSIGKLSPLQERILVQLAAIEPPWTLTGGAALAGFHTHHRETRDLDLFFRQQTSLGSVLLKFAPTRISGGVQLGATIILVDGVLRRSRSRSARWPIRGGERLDVNGSAFDPTPPLGQEVSMRMLIGIVFGCALMIGVTQAASSGATERAAQPSSQISEPAEDAQPEGDTSYECKYSPYCQSSSQCEAYCAGGAAVCFQGCCACAS